MLTILENISQVFLDSNVLHQRVASNLGLVCVIMVVVAAWLWVFFGRSIEGYQITSVYWLACGLSLWLAGRLLPTEQVLPAVLTALPVISIVLVYGLTLRVHHRWLRAWPENLQWLHQRPKIPPALAGSLISVSIFVLFVGLCYMTTWFTCILVTFQAVALLIAADLDYRDELAIIGFSQVSLALISALLALTVGKGAEVPSILNVILFAMAFLAFLWSWLSRVWKQQIIDGQPLATAGKMTGIATHMGIIVLGIGTLLSIKLVMWPLSMMVVGWDNDPGRMIAGPIAIGLMVLAGIWSAGRLQRVNLALLALINLAALIMLFVVRVEGLLSNGFRPYWPVWIIGWAAVMGVIAIAFAAGRNWPLGEAAKRMVLFFCPVILLAAVWKGPDQWKLTSLLAVAAIYVVAAIVRFTRPAPQT